jgi:hypothetical protein
MRDTDNKTSEYRFDCRSLRILCFQLSSFFKFSTTLRVCHSGVCVHLDLLQKVCLNFCVFLVVSLVITAALPRLDDTPSQSWGGMEGPSGGWALSLRGLEDLRVGF